MRTRSRLAGSRRAPPPAPAWVAFLVVALVAVQAAGCGHASPGPQEAPPGTVHLVNQTDQGMAPDAIVAFYLQRSGEVDPGPNRLQADLPPGGVVIVGLFPPGSYDAVAVLAGGGNVTWLDVPVRSGEPTDFEVPGI